MMFGRMSLITSMLPAVWSQALLKPQPLNPTGPAPRYHRWEWTVVPEADRYKVRVFSVADPACPGVNEPNFRAEVTEAIAEAEKVCSKVTCTFKIKPGQGLPPGVTTRNLGYIHRARACKGKTHTGELYIWHWSVQALQGSTVGPESEKLSFSLQE